MKIDYQSNDSFRKSKNFYSGLGPDERTPNRIIIQHDLRSLLFLGSIHLQFDLILLLGAFSPLGLENNIIPVIQLTSSSSRDANHTAREARLYNFNAWCAGGSGTNEYLQVNLGELMTITGLATQGDPHGSGWVKTYNVSYSKNGKEWREVQTFVFGNVSVKSYHFEVHGRI